jgi:hypothetical protein
MLVVYKSLKVSAGVLLSVAGELGAACRIGSSGFGVTQFGGIRCLSCAFVGVSPGGAVGVFSRGVSS